MRGNDITNVTQQSKRRIVRSVVNDIFHEVTITASGDRFEEVAFNCFASVSQAVVCNCLFRARYKNALAKEITLRLRSTGIKKV